MSSRYLDMMSMSRVARRPFKFTSRFVMACIATVGMVCSAVYWWGIQSQLTDNMVVAIAFTAILVLAPPSLVSFLIPWSPGGMLLQRIQAKTWGYAVVFGCALYLLYYSFQLQLSWWWAQPVVAESNLVYQQVLVGIIGFIIIPALMWAPVTSEELVEQVKQAHLVKRYELQTQADIAILRSSLLRAQEKALIGFANLTVEEREELTSVMRGLVTGIDSTLREVGHSVKVISGAMVPFEALDDNDDVQEILNYIGDSLAQSTMSYKDEYDVNEDDRPTQHLSTTKTEFVEISKMTGPPVTLAIHHREGNDIFVDINGQIRRVKSDKVVRTYWR